MVKRDISPIIFSPGMTSFVQHLCNFPLDPADNIKSMCSLIQTFAGTGSTGLTNINGPPAAMHVGYASCLVRIQTLNCPQGMGRNKT